MRAEFSTHARAQIAPQPAAILVDRNPQVKHIGYIVRFLWNATRGHRLAPWRSPYLRWRIETYTGIKMQSIGFLEFFGFAFRERRELVRFLTWTGEMERYARVKPKNP